jgi:hypothetical protein
MGFNDKFAVFVRSPLAFKRTPGAPLRDKRSSRSSTWTASPRLDFFVGKIETKPPTGG